MRYVILILTLVFIALLAYYLSQPAVTTVSQQMAEAKAEAQNANHDSEFVHDEGAVSQNPEDYMMTKVDPVTGYIFKMDMRLYSATPNMAAVEGKWSKDHDFMTLVTPNPQIIPPFYIDAFEALISDGKAWSVPGQTPTDRLRFNDAQAACKASGKRMCSETEWRTACRGGSTQRSQFSNLNTLARTCDIGRTKGQDENDYIGKTDSHPDCTPPGLGIYHMIGNVAEFVQSANGDPMIVGLTYGDGGANETFAQKLAFACEATVKSAGTYRPFKYYNTRGFRCCRDAQ